MGLSERLQLISPSTGTALRRRPLALQRLGRHPSPATFCWDRSFPSGPKRLGLLP